MSKFSYVQVSAALLAGLLDMPVTLNVAHADELLALSPGQTPAQAMQSSRVREISRSLQTSWLAGGHTAAAAPPPAITGGTVVTETVTIGKPANIPRLTFSYQAEAGMAGAVFDFVGPNGKGTYETPYVPYGYSVRGAVTFEGLFLQPPTLNLYSPSGVWTLSSATVFDLAGGTTTYDAAQLARLFTRPSFTVVNNGSADGTAPQVLSGKLITNTVSRTALFPAFRSTITAVDTGSGLYQAIVFLSPPGSHGSSFGQVAPLQMPARKAAVSADTVLSSTYPTGLWHIVSYQVCDYASNCTVDDKKSDLIALFGTDTFTVTP